MNKNKTTNDSLFYVFLLLISIIVNVIAFIFQFLFYELPCPLCLLQRFGFLGIGFGALLILSRNKDPKYDLIITVSSLFVLFVAIRQILLHIMPNDTGYGKSFLGLHFYSWSAILSFLIIISMLLYKLFNSNIIKFNCLSFNLEPIILALKTAYIIIILCNLIFTFLECSITACPENPKKYMFFN